MSLRRSIRYSDHGAAKLVRSVYYLPRRISLPIPIIPPLAWFFVSLRSIYWFFKRVFIAEPFFKAYCRSYGRNFHTGVFLHWIQGDGVIVAGNNVRIDGKCSFKFAASYSPTPTLSIGDDTGIGHDCSFTVGKSVTIGRYCRISQGVVMMDAPGHPANPIPRQQGRRAPDEDVRPIVIGDNVWIGRGAMILPGVTIGEGSVVAAGSVVMSSVSPNALIAGNPARQVKTLDPTAQD
ncbi:MAG TPA: acyltransferase [Acidobacteriaceae bacterium]|jgi:acetyltransferase-like isoleucine patch superfamily enzyme